MVRPDDPQSAKRKGPAILLLNGKAVGTVQAKGWTTSWGFGDFIPNEAFSDFAPIYGTWSLLMHAEDDRDRLSRETVEELSKAEALLDSIKAQLVFVDDEQTINVATVTIDGNQLEWKEI